MLPKRVVLYILSLTCMIVSFIMRSVMSFAILAMVREENATGEMSNYTLQLCFVNNKTAKTSYGGVLNWSLNVQYYILSSFHWTYIIAQVVGGYTAQRYGSKLVVGLGILVSSICMICIPLATVSYVLVIIIQLIHGFGQGVLWPALYGVISWWIPMKERSRFVTCFQGISVGAMISQSTSGLVIQAFGWKYVFYIFGVTGLLWCFAWYTFMHDKPETHPKINLDELSYIQTNREKSLNGGMLEVPWLKILCSLPVWAIAISAFGRMWFISVVMMYGPMYLKTVIGLNVQMNGLLSSTISCATYLATIIFSYISDKILTHQLLSTITNRKLFTAIGQIIPGLLCISMSYLGCNLNLIIAVWGLVQIATSACFAGVMVNIVDIAPNFTGPVMSIIQTILLTPNILSTMVAKSFLEQGSSLDSWRNIFNTSAGITLGTYLIYSLFASADVQTWDKAVSNKNGVEESQALK